MEILDLQPKKFLNILVKFPKFLDVQETKKKFQII